MKREEVLALIELARDRGAQADLRGANLHWADLRGVNLDFSCWPLWCGSLTVAIDAQQARQLAYHLAAVLPDDVQGDWLDGFVEFANGWDGIARHHLQKIGKGER